MFIRKNKNRSGSISIQILMKQGRSNKLVKTIGCAHTSEDESRLMLLAKNELNKLKGTRSLFVDHDDIIIENFVESITNDDLQIVGAELILGRIYDKIGYPADDIQNHFRSLVLCRLVYPGSKLKTTDYFKRHLKKDISVYSVYRYLDKFHAKWKDKVEKITFEHTKQLLKGKIGVVFYDMTTLYFEASEEDDFRITGFSKDGKHQQPQIMVGLLISNEGYPIGYDLFEGNTSETKTLIPLLNAFQLKFDIEKPVVVADAGLLSKKNIEALEKANYNYILGGRIKNESERVKSKILKLNIEEGKPQELVLSNRRLILTYSAKRAKKDAKNREKGIKRLEKKIASGKLSKSHINNRGYNKYLKLSGDVDIAIDYEKYKTDSHWDGLKGYVTNTKLSRNSVVDNYSQLWHVERAFRISKTDLRIRPIYHRLKRRIESHICICFSAYAVYKEFERIINVNGLDMSTEKAIEELKNISQLTYTLPKSGKTKEKLLKLNQSQTKLIELKI